MDRPDCSTPFFFEPDLFIFRIFRHFLQLNLEKTHQLFNEAAIASVQVPVAPSSRLKDPGFTTPYSARRRRLSNPAPSNDRPVNDMASPYLSSTADFVAAVGHVPFNPVARLSRYVKPHGRSLGNESAILLRTARTLGSYRNFERV